MTADHDAHIRAFLADEARRVTARAPALDAAVSRLAPRLGSAARGGSRSVMVLLAASLLLAAALGATIAIGSGLVRLPVVVDELPTEGEPAYEAVFLRVQDEGDGREVIVIGIGESGREREIARVPDGWTSLHINGGLLAPMGAVSTSGLLAMPSGTTGEMQWRIHDLHDPTAVPIDVPDIHQDIEQMQSTPYFAADMRPSVFWRSEDQVAIPWYRRLSDGRLDYHLSFVDGRSGAATAVDVPDDLWILPRWTEDGTGVLLGAGPWDPTPLLVAYSDGTVVDAGDVDASDAACRTRYESADELVIDGNGVERVSDDTRRQLATGVNITFACLAPDETMVVFDRGVGNVDGAPTAARPLAGLIVPAGGDWIEVEGSFAGWMEVVP